MASAPSLSAEQMTEYLGQIMNVEKGLRVLDEERSAFIQQFQPMETQVILRRSYLSSLEGYREHRHSKDPKAIEALDTNDIETALGEARKRLEEVTSTNRNADTRTFLGWVVIVLGAIGAAAAGKMILYLPAIIVALILFGGDPIEAGKERKARLEQAQKDVTRLKNALTDEGTAKRLEALRSDYEHELEKYNSYIETRESHNEAARQHNATRDDQIAAFDSALEDARKVRRDIYNLYRIIQPKYRNLTAICTLYEYFRTGRVFTLYGPGGAYNLYESELLQKTIIDKLDNIDRKLDDIKRGQYQLYVAVTETNRQIDAFRTEMRSLAADVRDIRVSSAVTAACAAVAAENTTAIKYIALMS